MKILLAYDGSKPADDALIELGKAGLPTEDVEAVILTVAETWMPTTGEYGAEEYLSEAAPDWVERHQKVKLAALNEAESLSRHASESLQKKFPGWKISSKTAAGSPARKILENADVFCPDLIILGSQGKNEISRLFLGSISVKILSEAKCAVRIARKLNTTASASAAAAVRIIVGFDATRGAEAAVEAVVARQWNKNSEVFLVAATDSIVPESIGRFMNASINWVEKENRTECRWIEKIARPALQKLKDAGFRAEVCVRPGNPKQILVDEANKFGADCIFVGANSLQNGTELYQLGSVSAAVAERAPCSVEIVRNNHFKFI